jgi:hypothetical protein
MITIDVSQLDHRPRSPYPGVHFYRTDKDRRPARPYVRPNDGPDPKREAHSERIHARLVSKRDTAASGSTRSNADICHEILKELAASPRGVRGLAQAVFITENRCSILTSGLAELGHITKVDERTETHRVLCSITALGLARLQAQQPAKQEAAR